MKRLTLVLMVLALLCGTAAALAAYTVPFPVNLRLGSDDTYDVVWHDGYILMKNHSAVFRYRPGAEEAEMMFPVTADSTRIGDSVPFFEYLLKDGGQLYAYERTRRLLAPIAPVMGNANFGERVELQDAYRGGTATGWFMKDGRMYTVYSVIKDSEGNGTLTIHDAKTGAGETIRVPGLMDLLPRAAGGWLAVFRDEKDPAKAALYAMDDLTGGRQALFPLPYPANEHMRVLEDERNGRYFLLTKGTGYMVPGKVRMVDIEGRVRWQVGNAFIESDALPQRTNMLLTDVGQLMVRDLATMTFYTPGESAETTRDNTTLYVYGVQPDDPRHRRAAARVTGVQVEVVNARYGQAALAELLVTGAQPVDAFVLQGNFYDLPRLAEKGWLLPLTEPADTQRVERLHQLLKKAVKQEGQLVGLLVGADMSLWFADREALAGLGEEVPATFEDLCALVTRWQEDDAVALYPAYAWDGYTYRSDLLNKAHSMYLSGYTSDSITYDTAAFRQMVQAADAVPPSPVRSVRPRNEGRTDVPLLLDYPQDGYSLALRTRDFEEGSGFAPLPLKMPDGTPVRPLVSTTVACVNAKSTMQEAALAYIRAYYDLANDEERLMITGEGAEPLVNPAFLNQLAENEQRLALWQSHKEKGTLPDNTTAQELDETIARLTLWLAGRKGEYRVSAEALEEYKSLMDRAQLYDYASQSVLYSTNMFTLFERFEDGQMDLERYIAEIENVLRLMQAEGM